MNNTQQKDIATKCLEKLDIYKPYIKKFKSTGMPCFYENYAGFWVDQEPEVYNKMKEVEEEYKVLVYALTHEITDYGETWSMLCVPQDTDGVDDLILPTSRPDTFYTFSYVWNKSNPIFSELGDIVVRTLGGGIKRVH